MTVKQAGDRENAAVDHERRRPAPAGRAPADSAVAALQARADACPRVGQLQAMQALANRRRSWPLQRRVSIKGQEWGHAQLDALGLESAATEQLGKWIDDDEVHVFRDSIHALNEAEDAAKGAGGAASQIWDNQEARFQTENTANDKGNSTYHAYPGGLDRYAPVNSGDGRPSDQVDNKDPGRHVCFIDSGAEALVLAQADDGKFRIEAVTGATVTIGVYDEAAGDWQSFSASLVPKVGLTPLDFYYVSSDGKLVGIHIGHRVCKILS